MVLLNPWYDPLLSALLGLRVAGVTLKIRTVQTAYLSTPKISTVY